MFIAALEYRKYVQRPRSADEKAKKLTSLALKEKKINESELSFQPIMQQIMSDYRRGVDILDPDWFTKADLEEFAEKNKITHAPLVIEFIDRAKN